MYIDKLYYQNVGPISKLNINFRKNDNGVPVPLVVVGKNGSGKSILLSNIVDAFYELADMAYDNATEANANGHQYYKEIAPAQIRTGQSHMLAHIHFQQDANNVEYLFKAGELSFDKYKEDRGFPIANQLNWNQESNFKAVIAEERIVHNIFEKDILCYFGPNRYMKPSWMGNK